jgi:chorismate dehydratase
MVSEFFGLDSSILASASGLTLRFRPSALKFQMILNGSPKSVAHWDGRGYGELCGQAQQEELAMTTPIRVGAVSYLNAKPLYYGLCDHAPEVRLSMDVPSRLAEQLARSELDVALIPSVEYLRGAQLGYEIIPGFAIAAHGPVRSVKLFTRVPWHQVRRLALDAGSRTSQVLARIWLDERHGVRPACVEELPLGVSALESAADAVLVIGDRAMRVPHEPFADVVDLGEAWHALTRLPFVFALWVARADANIENLPEALGRSRALGLAHADELARTHGPRLGLDHATCYDYLTRVLSYNLGEAEVSGLDRFAAMAARLGLAPEGVSLVFHRGRDLAGRR